MCNQTTIGVRALCESLTPPPVYKYYLDDLNGITYKNYAKVTSTTASALFNKAIQEGINSTISDALFSVGSPIQLTQVVNLYYHRDFSSTIYPAEASELGLVFNMLVPSQAQYSSIVIRKFYVNVATATPTLDININDGNTIVHTETLTDVEAGVTYEVVVDITLKNSFGSITFNHDGIDSYIAEFNPTYKCCGNITIYHTGFNYVMNKSIGKLKLEGGLGVSADIDLICDEEKVKCTLIPYLGEEIRFKAGIYLANEVLVSDRVDLFVLNNKEDIMELAKQWQKEYDTKMARKVPQLLQSLRGTDSCCFKNKGVTKGILLI
jgi:hypothetical protein